MFNESKQSNGPLAATFGRQFRTHNTFDHTTVKYRRSLVCLVSSVVVYRVDGDNSENKDGNCDSHCGSE